MNTKLFVLPSLCLGGAALLLAPSRPSQAFSKIGGSLGETYRDVRVHDNFADIQSNNNITPHGQFPGYVGAELAVWKGFVEWGSLLHGNGNGDPLNGNLLGNGAANFDAFWSGNADGIGGINDNIVSALADCGGGGTLAYTETPISNGWRIRYCDEWTWDDGPGTISNRWDIEGVMTHEYGHALGLGHSAVGSATMAPSGSPGQTSIRSIEADDAAGIQCVYGVASGTKPTIVATAANSGAGTITIYGTNFGATDNEVWFTNETVTATGIDPIVRVTGATSDGTVITVSIPQDAGPGDVLINKAGAGGATLSNAFPTDLVGTFGEVPGDHPDITSVSPSSIDALIPGTAETITLTGVDFLLATDVLLDAVAIDPARYTIVNDTTITLDMPQASSLGTHDLGVSDGIATDEFAVTIVVPASPKLELGTGDPNNVVGAGSGLDLIVSGTVGSLHVLRTSPTQIPTLERFLNLGPANPSAPLYNGGGFTIPAQGWHAASIGQLPDPGVLGMTWFGRSFEAPGPQPWPSSNSQSIFLVQ